MAVHKVRKEEFTNLLSVILEATGCRELCRQCVEKHTGYYYKIGWKSRSLILNKKTYGKSRGGCCGVQKKTKCNPAYKTACKFLGEDGCSLKPRSLNCTAFICETLRKRLSEFGLCRWFELLRRRTFRDVKCQFPLYDMREKVDVEWIYLNTDAIEDENLTKWKSFA